MRSRARQQYTDRGGCNEPMPASSTLYGNVSLCCYVSFILGISDFATCGLCGGVRLPASYVQYLVPNADNGGGRDVFIAKLQHVAYLAGGVSAVDSVGQAVQILSTGLGQRRAESGACVVALVLEKVEQRTHDDKMERGTKIQHRCDIVWRI